MGLPLRRPTPPRGSGSKRFVQQNLEPAGLRLAGYNQMRGPHGACPVGCGGAHDVLLKDTTAGGNQRS